MLDYRRALYQYYYNYYLQYVMFHKFSTIVYPLPDAQK